ncbi:hypothetical protein ACXR0O_03980 [Verrucomicrobiota bacterium sgz303538]
MNLSRPARTLLCSAVAACALSIPEARAALFAYEPFEYSTTSGPDVNNDGKVDLSGLNGGFGFGGAWDEEIPEDDSTTHAFDFIQAGSLSVPLGSAGLWTTGNSLRLINTTVSRATTLKRNFASTIATTDGTSLWFSILVQKEVNHLASGPDIAETFAVRLVDSTALGSLSLLDIDTSLNYGLLGLDSSQSAVANTGPTLLKPDLLVVKLSFLAGGDTMELFVNPALGVEPTSPNASLTIPGAGLSDIGSIQISSDNISRYRTQWSFDEFRIGQTYQDVTVPEPTSGLLAAFGLATVGMSRFRRTRIAQN